jgi:integrase
MARNVRHRFESRTARLKLAIRKKPYSGPALGNGVTLLYRRNAGNGTWVVKAPDGKGGYWTKRIAEADDYAEADSSVILTYFAAQDRAKALAGGGDSDAAASSDAPVTVGEALDAYAKDLEARKANPHNASRARGHLPNRLLATPVATLKAKELKDWRDGLLAKMTPASVNRLVKGLRAALELARRGDGKRIRSNEAWKSGLEALPNTERARNVILSDAEVLALVAAAYKRDPALGLLLDVLAVTGARPSQAVRLLVEDLIDPISPIDLKTGKQKPRAPKLFMPKSAKGGGRDRAKKRGEQYPVPITPELADKLTAAMVGRDPDAPLLLRADGLPWGDRPALIYRNAFRAVVADVELDPAVVTAYALRHSSIVRMLLHNKPIRVVAALHNTSVSQIEANYSRHIAAVSDDVVRDALLTVPADDAKVVSLRR